MADYSFPRYLAAKRSVDDRALNQAVWSGLAGALRGYKDQAVRLLEIGAGTGTMLERLYERDMLRQACYLGIDMEAENVASARAKFCKWAERAGLPERDLGGPARIELPGGWLEAQFEQADVFDFLERWTGKQTWDVLLANAFLDLVDIRATLPRLLPLVEPGGWFCFTINFDGLTALEPQVDPAFDELVIALYHRSMDERLTAGKVSGDSRAGRHLFQILRECGYELVEAGSSDWIVFPRGGAYPADEAYFLHFILHFFEDSLTGHAELDSGRFKRWLAARRRQVENCELTLFVHQLDFLARRPPV